MGGGIASNGLSGLGGLGGLIGLAGTAGGSGSIGGAGTASCRAARRSVGRTSETVRGQIAARLVLAGVCLLDSRQVTDVVRIIRGACVYSLERQGQLANPPGGPTRLCLFIKMNENEKKGWHECNKPPILIRTLK